MWYTYCNDLLSISCRSCAHIRAAPKSLRASPGARDSVRRRRHSTTRVAVMPEDDQSNGRDPRSSSASLALSTDSSASHTPDASDTEDVEGGSNVDSDVPALADALDATADEDKVRATRPQSSSPWAFPPSAKYAGGRNAPNVLPVVSPPVKKDGRKSNTYLMIGVGLCIGVVIFFHRAMYRF